MGRNSVEKTTIPAIMIVCEHCGFIAQHALQPLGISDQHIAGAMQQRSSATMAST
jgi:hypothetical protein